MIDEVRVSNLALIEEAELFGLGSLLEALQTGPESLVKCELCNYVIKNGYSLDIIPFILSVSWLVG